MRTQVQCDRIRSISGAKTWGKERLARADYTDMFADVFRFLYALERRRSARQPVVLVRTVAAVVAAVADVRLEHALRVVALKVVGLARHLSARFRLVRVVVAVGRPVAVPRLRYADARLLAPELLLRVALVRRQRGCGQTTFDLVPRGWGT